MTCYVDDPIHKFGRMLMCHLWADTEEELLRMVDTIGVQRKWIQGHPTLSHGKHRDASWVHFDVSKAKRLLAIKAGARPTDMFGPLEHTAKLLLAKGKIEGNQELIDHAQNKLLEIVNCRARRNAGKLL